MSSEQRSTHSPRPAIARQTIGLPTGRSIRLIVISTSLPSDVPGFRPRRSRWGMGDNWAQHEPVNRCRDGQASDNPCLYLRRSPKRSLIGMPNFDLGTLPSRCSLRDQACVRNVAGSGQDAARPSTHAPPPIMYRPSIRTRTWGPCQVSKLGRFFQMIRA